MHVETTTSHWNHGYHYLPMPWSMLNCTCQWLRSFAGHLYYGGGTFPRRMCDGQVQLRTPTFPHFANKLICKRFYFNRVYYVSYHINPELCSDIRGILVCLPNMILDTENSFQLQSKQQHGYQNIMVAEHTFSHSFHLQPVISDICDKIYLKLVLHQTTIAKRPVYDYEYLQKC